MENTDSLWQPLAKPNGKEEEGVDEGRCHRCSKPLIMFKSHAMYTNDSKFSEYRNIFATISSPWACFHLPVEVFYFFLSIEFAGADSRRCQEMDFGTDCQANYQTANVGLASIRVLGLRRLPSLTPAGFPERVGMLFINTSPWITEPARSGQLRKARIASSLQMQRRRSRSQMKTRLSISLIAWHDGRR